MSCAFRSPYLGVIVSGLHCAYDVRVFFVSEPMVSCLVWASRLGVRTLAPGWAREDLCELGSAALGF